MCMHLHIYVCVYVAVKKNVRLRKKNSPALLRTSVFFTCTGKKEVSRKKNYTHNVDLIENWIDFKDDKMMSTNSRRMFMCVRERNSEE